MSQSPLVRKTFNALGSGRKQISEDLARMNSPAQDFFAPQPEIDKNQFIANNPNVEQKEGLKKPPLRSDFRKASPTKETREPLPELPAGLSWPTDTYAEAHREHGWDILKYLNERWLPILNAGRESGRILATRRILDDLDPSAITAIENYTRAHPRTGERKLIPECLRFPTFKERNDRLIATAEELAPEAVRLARNRAKRPAKLQHG